MAQSPAAPAVLTVRAAESPAAPTDGARINSSHPLLPPRDTLLHKKRLGGLGLLLKIVLLRGEVLISNPLVERL